MINPKNKLVLYYKDDVSPAVEFSREVIDYGRDSYAITLKSNDTIYIGYDKPINAAYIEYSTLNTNAGNLTVERFTNTGFVEVSGFDDDTRNALRSGFIQWEREEESSTHIESEPEAGMGTRYWFRLTTDTTQEATVIKGLNIVFADDEDLKREIACITDASFLQGATTHILTHQKVRDDIVQYFRNRGFKKQNRIDQDFQLLLPWDLLDIQEVREGAVYLALAKIFFNLSDSPEDVWYQKSLFYRAEYQRKIDLVQFSVDVDDDGEIDPGEGQHVIKPSTMRR